MFRCCSVEFTRRPTTCRRSSRCAGSRTSPNIRRWKRSAFRAAYHHMWVEPKKMDDLEIFRNAFISSGIDVDRLIARAQQDDVKKKLIEDTTDAVNRGAFGSPTFFVGQEMFFGKDQLRDVEESIIEQTTAVRSRIA